MPSTRAAAYVSVYWSAGLGASASLFVDDQATRTWQRVLVHVSEGLGELQGVLEQELVAEGLPHVLREEAVAVHACHVIDIEQRCVSGIGGWLTY